MYYTGGTLKLPLRLLVSREEGVAGAQQEQAGDRAGGRRTPYTAKGRCWAKTIQSYTLTIITAKNRPALTIERVRLLPVKPSIQMGYNQLKE